MTDYTLHLGDCLEIVPTMEAESVDAVVCDPPYGLSFMGRDWDHGVPGEHFWREALRVAKPGAHLLAFGGTRTFHRLACAIEDAGWELRDTVMWVYGSGFPKSADVSKHIDKQAGAEREVVGRYKHPGRDDDWSSYPSSNKDYLETNTWGVKPDRNITAPATPAAAQWQGWGTALKPAWEPIIMARKPLERGLTVAGNVLKWGTGAVNVDGGRVEAGDGVPKFSKGIKMLDSNTFGKHLNGSNRTGEIDTATGRWPANLIHDGSDEVLAGFPVTNSGGALRISKGGKSRAMAGALGPNVGYRENDGGSAARFFYCAKASKRDRDEGCEGLEERRPHPPGNEWATTSMWNGENGDEEWRKKNPNLPRRNHHPTVKPTALMRYLVRLVTPPGGLVLDPFMGSGSTGKAALIEGFGFAGIEQDAEYIEIARRRIAYVERQRLHNVEQLPAWVGDVWE